MSLSKLAVAVLLQSLRERVYAVMEQNASIKVLTLVGSESRTLHWRVY